MYKITYCSIVYDSKRLDTGDWMNKLWYVYLLESYAVVRKKEETLHIQTCRDFQNIFVK